MRNWNGWGNAPPIVKTKVWSTDYFVSEFCDYFADDLNVPMDVAESWQAYGRALDFLIKLAGGEPLPSATAAADGGTAAAVPAAQAAGSAAQTLPKEPSPFKPELSAKFLPRVKKLRAAVEAAEALYRKYQNYQQWKMQYYLSKMIDDVVKLVNSVTEADDIVVLPLLVPSAGESGTSMIVELADGAASQGLMRVR